MAISRSAVSGPGTPGTALPSIAFIDNQRLRCVRCRARDHARSGIMRRFAGFFLALTILSGSVDSPAAAQDKTLTVFAAASMKNALDDIDAAYTAKTGVRIVASYAASSALAKQIEQGAPADIFASA